MRPLIFVSDSPNRLQWKETAKFEPIRTGLEKTVLRYYACTGGFMVLLTESPSVRALHRMEKDRLSTIEKRRRG